jgi:hypothetical protein
VPIQDYGFYKPPTQATLNSDFIANLGCSAADEKCLSSLSSSAIIEASQTVLADASTLDPAIGFGEVLRPGRDGTFVTSSLTSSTTFPKQTKPILVTTVREEAAYVIYRIYEEPVSTENYPSTFVVATRMRARSSSSTRHTMTPPPASTPRMRMHASSSRCSVRTASGGAPRGPSLGHGHVQVRRHTLESSSLAQPIRKIGTSLLATYPAWFATRTTSRSSLELFRTPPRHSPRPSRRLRLG